MKCGNCASEEIYTDSARGSVYCGECGMVQEENTIVSTLQFDSTAVKPTMQGKIISVDNVNVGTQFIDSSYYIKNTIKSICIKLSLSNEHVDCAFRWYKLCLQHSISKGKSILYTLSACVYITCRQESTPHLLIDFSNELRIDMFKIGKVFLKLRNLLGIDIPLIDPSLYMHRFVSQLKFKNKEILSLSIRLVSRMKKDWILTGRRPSNSCGAALLIASRIFKEERDITEISKVVHTSIATIRKRLKEIEQTESANLGIEEFRNIWLEEESNPPIFRKQANNLSKKEQIIKTEQSINEEYSKDLKKNSDKKMDLEIKMNEILNDEEILSNMNGPLNDEINGIFNNMKGILNEDQIELLDTPRETQEELEDNDSFDYDGCILNEEETRNKTIIWEELYGDYVKVMEVKRSNKPKVIQRNRRKRHNFDTVEEAFQNLDKKVSSKLNYAALEGLFED
jgi:transcription factor IIIB 90 kDa subunit